MDKSKLIGDVQARRSRTTHLLPRHHPQTRPSSTPRRPARPASHLPKASNTRRLLSKLTMLLRSHNRARLSGSNHTRRLPSRVRAYHRLPRPARQYHTRLRLRPHNHNNLRRCNINTNK